MLSRALAGLAITAAAVSMPAASADPEPAPAPAPPSVQGLTPVSPVPFTVADGIYAFSAPVGVNCVVSKTSRSYGCSGTMPGAPNGANTVTGGAAGEPGFSAADRPLFHFDGTPQELGEGTRIGTGTISCGVVAGGVVCDNSFDQTGFVISSAGTYSYGAVNPLLDRPEGTNPYFN
ncbi:hypothetical protein [Mycolicibacterium brumae]|uniref:Secreted protein n=1 Tax=Mycolicibacterium brumae TaxID=85968 RepID=A0A2G5PHG7_9MYCO|nr:hypothetical protein [Mycolicibacterium brumae]MCV7192418.1 hypothetical protein [Mycolicibacterium brumae]PIB77755.1 hypothetical protein CQY22_001005 [Mycolicibacterium brumae]UWW10186.1 hypothetical protein L2Z93_003312 [Mycolicibacterium brumae]